MKKILTSVIYIATFFILIPASNSFRKKYDRNRNLFQSSTPLIIAHRGASGFAPEHTLGSYSLAMTMGADLVEPDLVITKDGYLVARHDNEISITTDVELHPEFSSRYTTKLVDGKELTGWFVEDFTLKELKTLRALERIPLVRPGNVKMNGAFEIPTFQEIIDLVKGMEQGLKRTIGIYPEIKHSTYFKNLGLPMEEKVVETLHSNGYYGPDAPVIIQSFEVSNLLQLKNMTSLKLLQLYDTPCQRPYDQVQLGSSLTYKDMSSLEGLRQVSNYAYAVGPDKSYIIPRDQQDRLGTQTLFVNHAHEVGLRVHPYTFRAENQFLPAELRSRDEAQSALGDLKSEIQAYLDAGVDAIFTDYPNVAYMVLQENNYS